MPQIKIKVLPGGKVVLDYEGYHGESCWTEEQALAAALRAVGAALEVEKTQPKEDVAYTLTSQEVRSE